MKQLLQVIQYIVIVSLPFFSTSSKICQSILFYFSSLLEKTAISFNKNQYKNMLASNYKLFDITLKCKIEHLTKFQCSITKLT